MRKFEKLFRRFRSNSTAPRRRTKRLGFEPLEGRDMLAGNVIAALSGGNLRVKGDALDNEIRIGITDGDLVVEGLNGTTVNRQATPLVAVAGSDTIPRSVVVSLKQGNDSLLVEGIKVTGRTTIYGNRGSDLIEVRGDSEFTRNLTIIGGASDDVIFVHDNTTPIEGKVTIRGKKFGDTIGLENNVFNAPVNVSGNASNDSIAAFSNTFNGTYRADGGGRVDRYGEDAGGNIFNDNRRVIRFEEVDGTLAPPIQDFLPELPPTVDVSVDVSPSSVDEDGATNLDYTFTRSGDTTSALTVDFSVDGSATFDTDYTQAGADTFTATTGSVSFAPGSATAVVTVDPTADTTVEADETAILTVVDGSGYSVATPSAATGTIDNDDTATLTIAGVTMLEGTNGGTDFNFDVTLDNAVDGGFDLAFTVNDGAATAADDFSVTTTSPLTFAGNAAETQTITVQVDADSKVEPDEMFEVALGALSNLGPGIDAADISTSGSPATGEITNDDTATISIDDVTLDEGDAGTTAFTFTVSIDNPASEDITVVANTNAVTATGGGTDFADVVNQTVTITAGNLTGSLTVDVTGELLVENDETFEVNLTDARFNGATDATRATIGDAQGIGTITNDDTATISIDDVMLDEGDAGTTAFTFTVSIDNPASEDITVVANTNGVTATGGGTDFTDVVDQTVTITAGNTSTTLTVDVTGELLVEADETFEVNLTDAQFNGATDASRATIGDAQGIGTIINDDLATISIDDVMLDEGDAGTTAFTFTVSIDNPASEDITVVANTNGVTATGGGTDFADVMNQTVTITAGNLTASLTVDVTGELIVENDESFEVNLTDAQFNGVADATRAVIGDSQGIGTIVNDDAVTVSIDDVTLDEGNAGDTAFDFTVSIENAASEDVTVVVNTNGVTATGGGTDFTDLVDQTITITAGNTTATATVNVAGELLVEDDETFEVNLTDPRFGGVNDASRVTIGDAQGIGAITNDDTATISIDDVSMDEGNAGTTAFTFTVSIDNAASEDITVVANTNGVTADGGGTDFNDVVDQTVTITAGNTSASLTVDVIGELIVEADETFEVNLTDAQFNGATDATRATIGDAQGIGTIINDDTATVTIDDVTDNEGSSPPGTTSFVFTVSLDSDVQDGFTIAYTTNDGTATLADNDYQDNDNSLVFAGTLGETQPVTVLVNQDTDVEPDEMFDVLLGSLSMIDATAADDITIQPDGGTGTISNDD